MGFLGTSRQPRHLVQGPRTCSSRLPMDRERAADPKAQRFSGKSIHMAKLFKYSSIFKSVISKLYFHSKWRQKSVLHQLFHKIGYFPPFFFFSFPFPIVSSHCTSVRLLVKTKPFCKNGKPHSRLYPWQAVTGYRCRLAREPHFSLSACCPCWAGAIIHWDDCTAFFTK